MQLNVPKCAISGINSSRVSTKYSHVPVEGERVPKLGPREAYMYLGVELNQDLKCSARYDKMYSSLTRKFNRRAVSPAS